MTHATEGLPYWRKPLHRIPLLPHASSTEAMWKIPPEKSDYVQLMFLLSEVLQVIGKYCHDIPTEAIVGPIGKPAQGAINQAEPQMRIETFADSAEDMLVSVFAFGGESKVDLVRMGSDVYIRWTSEMDTPKPGSSRSSGPPLDQYAELIQHIANGISRGQVWSAP